MKKLKHRIISTSCEAVALFLLSLLIGSYAGAALFAFGMVFILGTNAILYFLSLKTKP